MKRRDYIVGFFPCDEWYQVTAADPAGCVVEVAEHSGIAREARACVVWLASSGRPVASYGITEARGETRFRPLYANPLEAFGPLFERWVTVGNHPVLISGDGRIRKGGRKTWQGVHVQDVPELERRIRDAEGVDCAADTECGRDGCPETFPSKVAGLAALLDANPELAEFLQNEMAPTDMAWLNWHKRGRKGPKPTAGAWPANLDSINERWELRGARKVYTWAEAVFVTVPTSRRWDDFAERLQVLEEATGLLLRLPAAASKREIARESVEECENRIAEAIGVTISEAQSGRIAATPF